MIFFSVIVPVYNVGSYIRECVESIIGQKFSSVEIILINDGSTDKSARICDEYAESCKLVRVIHKTKGGLSEARNAGLSTARGEYIMFVDGDDYIEPDSLAVLQAAITKSDNPDVLITRLKQVYEDSPARHMDMNMPVELTQKSDMIEWVFRKSQNTWPAQRYIIKRSLINHYNLKFAAGCFHEDLDWTSRLFLLGGTFMFSACYWYNHRMLRPCSITNSPDGKRTLDVIELVSKNINSSIYLEASPAARKAISDRLLSSLFFSLRHYKSAGDEDKLRIIDALKHNRPVLKQAKELRHRIFLSVCNLLGFRFGLYLKGLLKK